MNKLSVIFDTDDFTSLVPSAKSEIKKLILRKELEERKEHGVEEIYDSEDYEDYDEEGYYDDEYDFYTWRDRQNSLASKGNYNDFLSALTKHPASESVQNLKLIE